MQPGREMYGINAHLRDSNQLDKVRDVCAPWTRVTFPWWTIEKPGGRFDYGPCDQYVNRAVDMRLSIFASLAYTPDGKGGESMRNQPPDPAKWQHFVATTVARYRSHIKHWGIWNEPNMPKNWAGSPRAYRDQILKPGADVIHGLGADLNVVAPEVICTSEYRWWEWIREVADKGGAGCFDVFSCHVYKDKGAHLVIEMLEKGSRWADEVESWPPPIVKFFKPKYKAIRQVMSEAGIAGKPLWLTEVGWYTEGTSGADPVSAAKQAEYYSRLCTDAVKRSDWLQKVFFYELWDDPADAVERWGIVYRNGETKPAYNSYREFLQSLPGLAQEES